MKTIRGLINDSAVVGRIYPAEIINWSMNLIWPQILSILSNRLSYSFFCQKFALTNGFLSTGKTFRFTFPLKPKHPSDHKYFQLNTSTRISLWITPCEWSFPLKRLLQNNYVNCGWFSIDYKIFSQFKTRILKFS